jgi:hypothetical protein
MLASINRRSFKRSRSSIDSRASISRHGEIALGKPVGPDVEKTTFDDMAVMIVNDYKANGRRSLNRLENAINHLRGFFCQDKVREITSDRITAYIAYRQKEKAANSTVNASLLL